MGTLWISLKMVIPISETGSLQLGQVTRTVTYSVCKPVTVRNITQTADHQCLWNCEAKAPV